MPYFEFKIPLSYEDLLNSSVENLSEYKILHKLDLEELGDKEITSILSKIEESLVDKPEKITENELFDPLFCLVIEKNFSIISHRTKRKLIEIIQSSFESFVNRTSNLLSKTSQNDQRIGSEKLSLLRNSIKMFSFIVDCIIYSFEKSQKNNKPTILSNELSKKSGKSKKRPLEESEDQDDIIWTETSKEKLLSCLIHLLELPLDIFWRNSASVFSSSSKSPHLNNVEESFLNLHTKLAFSLLENPVNCKSKEVRMCIGLILSLLVARYHQTLAIVPSIVHSLYVSEHMVVPLLELLDSFTKAYPNHTLGGNVIREIASSLYDSKEFMSSGTISGQDQSGPKNISLFLVELADRQPILVHRNLSTLMPSLEREPYLIRNAVVQVIGLLLSRMDFKSLGELNEEGIDEEEEEQQQEDSDSEKSDQEINGSEFRKRKPKNTHTQKKLKLNKDELLGILLERVCDVNAYCRSKVLQVWSLLAESKLIPVKLLVRLTELVCGRIQDKAAQVRKSAIQLLTTILQYNPYSATLSLDHFSLQLTDSKKKLKELKSSKKEDEGDEKEECNNEIEMNVHKQERVCSFLEDCVFFLEEIDKVIPLLTQLLGSKNSSDILETINFFVISSLFQVNNSQLGVRKMLMLVTSRDPSIIEAAVSSFKRLYLDPSSIPPSQNKASSMALNLIRLIEGANLGELTCLEELLSQLMAANNFPISVLQSLWQIFVRKNEEYSKSQSLGALRILGMAANSSPELIRPKITLIISEGLNLENDEPLIRCSCVALQKLSKTNQKVKENIRFKVNHPIFAKLVDFLRSPSKDLSNWFSAAEQAINTIYCLCSDPGQVMSDLVKQMADTLFKSEQKSSQNNSCSVEELSRLVFLIGHTAIKQLIYIEEIQVELRRRLELNSCNNNKPQKEKEKNNNSDNKNETRSPKKRGKRKTAANVIPEITIEEELGLIPNEEEENDRNELLRQVAEKEIVGNSLLGKFGSLLVHICRNTESQFNDPELRASAVLSLCKFMIVSSEFCEQHLRLLFTILQKASEETVRSNIVISLGDLAFRFPLLIEPWTSHIYGRLRDRSTIVRKNTLMVLTHLILNDMIKVKGQISEMALCLEDPETRISDISRLFFYELSQKGNSLYNILPDVISKLSSADPSMAMPIIQSSNTPSAQQDTLATSNDTETIRDKASLSDESFKNIMKYLLGYIQKERQTEMLVEKLCQRFSVATDRQSRLVSFCLSILSYNPKSVKKLSELFPMYKTKLHDPEFHFNFISLIQKSRKFAKPDLKSALEELEKKIEQELKEGTQSEKEGRKDIFNEKETVTELTTLNHPLVKKKKTQTPAPSQRSKNVPTKRLETEWSSSDEEVDFDEIGSDKEPLNNHQTKTSKRTKPTRTKPQQNKSIIESDDDDLDITIGEDEEDDKKSKTNKHYRGRQPKGRRKTNPVKGRRRIIESDDENDDNVEEKDDFGEKDIENEEEEEEEEEDIEKEENEFKHQKKKTRKTMDKKPVKQLRGRGRRTKK